MKKKFLKYFIMCTAIILFMSSASKASTYSIPVWSNQTSNSFNTDSVLTNSKPSKTNKADNTTKPNNPTNANNTNKSNNSTKNVNAKPTPKLDTSLSSTNNPLKLSSGGAILIEQNTGKVLYDYNMHAKLRPASVTKVMTILLIMEAIDSGRISYTDKVPCSSEASSMGGSQIWLDSTEELTVNDMLKAICVVSANDCTFAMAEYLEGSEEAFVKKMNEKAKVLGMNDTCFKNCHGIDEDGHVTSPYDIAIMSRELLVKHPSITKYTTIYMDSLRDGKSELVNTNKLVRNYDGCTGLKTGSTSLALFNLSASATRNGLSLIAVVMKGKTSSERFTEARKLLDYGFSNFQYKDLGKAGDIVGIANVNKGIENSVQATLQNNLGAVMKKSNDTKLSQKAEIYNNINAPVSKGQKIGEFIVSLNNKEIAKSDIIAANDVYKYSFSSMVQKVFTSWFSLLREQ